MIKTLVPIWLEAKGTKNIKRTPPEWLLWFKTYKVSAPEEVFVEAMEEAGHKNTKKRKLSDTK